MHKKSIDLYSSRKEGEKGSVVGRNRVISANVAERDSDSKIYHSRVSGIGSDEEMNKKVISLEKQKSDHMK